jgi:hypothetical protein
MEGLSTKAIAKTNVHSDSFSLKLLHLTRINKDRIPSYAKFLDELEVEEQSVHLLTMENLKSFAETYKQKHQDFELKPLDAAAISEIASNYLKKGL